MKQTYQILSRNFTRRFSPFATVHRNLVFFRYCSGKKSHCLRARRPIRSALISGFSSIKRLGVFILPPGRDASPSQGYPQHYAGTQVYTWVERGTVRVKCLAQEHNAMSPARPRTRTTLSATAPPTREARPGR